MILTEILTQLRYAVLMLLYFLLAFLMRVASLHYDELFIIRAALRNQFSACTRLFL